MSADETSVLRALEGPSRTFDELVADTGAGGHRLLGTLRKMEKARLIRFARGRYEAIRTDPIPMTDSIATQETVASVTRSPAPDAADKGATSRQTDVKLPSGSAAVAQHGVPPSQTRASPADGSAHGGNGKSTHTPEGAVSVLNPRADRTTGGNAELRKPASDRPAAPVSEKVTTMTTRKCETCEQPKPIEDFRKVPTIFGGDGRSKSCKDCMQRKREKKKRLQNGAEQPAPEPDPNIPRATVSPGLGFSVRFEDDDLIIEQRRSTVWLSLYEFSELAKFVDGLKSPPPTPPEAAQ